MQKIARFLTVFLFGVLFLNIYSIAEEVTLTTYYPAPLGVYDALLTKTLGVGDTNADSSFSAADIPATSGDMWVAGNVGIGTITPQNELDVKGSVAIGAGNYAGVQLAPVNGLIVEGQVGIGTPTPGAGTMLDVNGTVNAASYSAGSTAPVADGTYTVGSKLTPTGQNGTITVKGGIITAVQEAT